MSENGPVRPMSMFMVSIRHDTLNESVDRYTTDYDAFWQDDNASARESRWPVLMGTASYLVGALRDHMNRLRQEVQKLENDNAKLAIEVSQLRAALTERDARHMFEPPF